jgi:hypothetical protein
MDNSEFCGKVIKVSFSRPPKIKNRSNKSVWQIEEYERTVA